MERAFYEEEQWRDELNHVTQRQEEHDNVPAAEEVVVEENTMINNLVDVAMDGVA